MDTSHILAPAGTTRRQLYILAHECGHIALHSAPRTGRKAALSAACSALDKAAKVLRRLSGSLARSWYSLVPSAYST
jgi:hypothetical protein